MVLGAISNLAASAKHDPLPPVNDFDTPFELVCIASSDYFLFVGCVKSSIRLQKVGCVGHIGSFAHQSKQD